MLHTCIGVVASAHNVGPPGVALQPNSYWQTNLGRRLRPAYVAVCCSVLQYVAGCCRVLQGVAGCCRVLQCVATLNGRPTWDTVPVLRTLQYVAVCCSML